jgi:hypothetical protein
MGIHALLSAEYQHTNARATTSLMDEVFHVVFPDSKVSILPGDLQADDVEVFDQPSESQSVELFFESFLQNVNHVLFLFSEFELRQSFRPSDCLPEENLPVDMCLVLALGAKYGVAQLNGIQNEWYAQARRRLVSKGFQDDMGMMRVLTMICIFEVKDDIDVSYRFLGEKQHLKPIARALN